MEVLSLNREDKKTRECFRSSQLSCKSGDKSASIYSQISVAWTSLGPCKFVRAMGSSSQWDLIMASGQEANDNSLWKCFRSSTK